MNNTGLLKIAQKHLGQGGSVFRKYCGLPSGSAWCCAFVTYIFHEGGLSPLFYGGKKVVYCPTAQQWCDTNLAQIPIYLAMPMDIIFFDWQPNGTADHIGFVKERKSAQEVYTIEGNTSGGIVANRTRVAKYVCGVYRPHYKATFDVSKRLVVDGLFGYNSIAVMQKWLGVAIDGILGRITIKALQKRLGVAQDGSWGRKTSKALQKVIGTTVDGDFGVNSVKAFQTYLNKQVFGNDVTSEIQIPVTATNKIAEKAKEYAWAYGTPEKKWAYKTGSARSVYKKALKKYMGYTSKISQSDCGYFVTTCVRASGVAKDFLALKGVKDPFPKVPKTMSIVFNGKKIPSGVLKAGDIIRYKKTNGKQHTLMYIGDNRIAEAGRETRFPIIRKDSKKYNADNVKHSTLQVIRAK